MKLFGIDMSYKNVFGCHFNARELRYVLLIHLRILINLNKSYLLKSTPNAPSVRHFVYIPVEFTFTIAPNVGDLRPIFLTPRFAIALTTINRFFKFFF